MLLSLQSTWNEPQDVDYVLAHSSRGCCGEGVTRRESEGEFLVFVIFLKIQFFLTIKQVEVETVRTGESLWVVFFVDVPQKVLRKVSWLAGG